MNQLVILSFLKNYFDNTVSTHWFFVWRKDLITNSNDISYQCAYLDNINLNPFNKLQFTRSIHLIEDFDHVLRQLIHFM